MQIETIDNATLYPRHSAACHAIQPGDRECNCHLAYGFPTADAMDEADDKTVSSDADTRVGPVIEGVKMAHNYIEFQDRVRAMFDPPVSHQHCHNAQGGTLCSYCGSDIAHPVTPDSGVDRAD